MMQVSIIVPAKNEAENLPVLAQRIHAALKKSKINYEIIVVDDYSTDSTSAVTLGLAKKYPVVLHKKKGKPGKAYAILEGAKKAKYSTLVMIDADLQYPPEEIPAMLELGKTHGVVVANRLSRDTSLLRKVSSKVNSVLFSKLLLGLNCDAQSGLKVFKKEIIEHLDIKDVSPWTLDMPLLITARDLGYTIGCTTIHFAERAGGASKIRFAKASAEIAYGAIKLKAKQKRVYDLPGGKRGSSLGAGIAYKKKRFITHTSLPHSQSALKTVTPGQKRFFMGLLGLLAAGIIFNAHSTLILLIGILTVIYFLDLVFSTYVLLKSLHFPPELSYSDEELAKLDDKTLPMYSILCPLYKESEVLPHFLDNINSIDYPKNKLDVLLLLEENDKETQDAAKALNLPSYVRVIVVPHSFPKTKPKACNYGLHFAKGEYVVIYDAEDRPDPMQLKKVYLGFQKLGDKYFCLQSKLNYYNASHNILTRLFTAEYSLWFDVILPGLQSIETTIPLGGTSNHFRTQQLRDFHAWDPFNVTEDCDLGVRLFKAGYKTAIVDSVTLEEANSNVKNWIRQRSRWIKGYFQTYLVHNRHPLQFFKTHGLQAFIFQLVIGMRISFILINPILWVATIAYFTLYSIVGPAIESLYPAPVFYMAVISLIFGNFLYFYNYMIGCAKREHWGVIKFVFLIPFYWIITSIAAGIAFYQLIVKPHYWEKTNHGLHLKGKKKAFSLSLLSLAMSSVKLPAKKAKQLATGDISAAGALIAASMVGNLCNFIYNAYLGRQVSLAEFGIVSLMNGILAFTQIPIGALSRTVSYKTAFATGKYGFPAKEFWLRARKRAFKISLVIATVWTLSIPFLAQSFKSGTMVPFILTTPFWFIALLSSIDYGYLQGSLKFKVLALMIVVESVSRLGIAGALVYTGFHRGVYIATPLASFLSFVIGFIAIKLSKQPALPEAQSEPFPKRFFTTSMLTKISSVTVLSLDVILAKLILNPSDAGLYALLSVTGNMVYFFGNLMSQFITPFISRAIGSGKNSKKVFYRILGLTTLVTLSAALPLIFYGSVIAPLMFGPKTLSIVQYLPLYVSAMVMYTVAINIVSYHQIKGHLAFPIISLLLALAEISVSVLFIHDLSAFVYMVSVLASSYLVISVLLHFLHHKISVFAKNVIDFIGLFQEVPNEQKLAHKGKKLRILVFNWRDTKHVWAGGAEVYIHELAKQWVKDGHKVTVFCGNDGKSPRNEIIDGVQMVRRGGFYTVYLWGFLYYVIRFKKLFDVVVDSENGLPFFTPVFVRVPKILLIHHIHQEVFRQHLKFPFNRIAMLIESKVMPIAYRGVKIITVSESSKKDIISLGCAQENAIRIVNPGVKVPHKRSAKTRYPSLVYVGRLKHYKNIDVAIRAFALTLKKYPTARFTIVGSGESLNRLKKITQELKLESSVVFAGKVTDQERDHILSSAWVCVQPSQLEGWGITVIEANAAGTPVVASNVPGLRDSVVDGKTGLLVPVKNVKVLSNVIAELFENKAYRTELSKNALAWSARYSWQESAEQFLEYLTDRAMTKRSRLKFRIKLGRKPAYQEAMYE